jgi:hypothetical protein
MLGASLRLEIGEEHKMLGGQRHNSRILVVSILLAWLISTSAIAGAKAKGGTPTQETPPEAAMVDKCGHPIVKDQVGASFIDPVCGVLSDKVQPPLYRPPEECNRGVVSYDLKCTFLRALTIMTGPPKPLL